jgi:hypothetical protein
MKLICRKKVLLTLNLFLLKIAFSEKVTTGDGFVEFGVGRFEYPSNWELTNSSPSLVEDGGFSFGISNSPKTVSGVFEKNSYSQTIQWNVETMHDIYSKNTAYSNVAYEYFETTEGYPAGLVYAEMSASGFTSKLATVYIDLTLDSDGSDFVMADLTLSWIDSLDEAKNLANGVMRTTSGSSAPRQSLSDLLSLPEISTPDSEKVTIGDGFVEFGVGRFEYPSNWELTNSSPSLVEDGGFSFGISNSPKTVSGVFEKNSYSQTIQWNVETMHDIYSKNTAYSNVAHEYFETTEGYPTGLVYAEMSASGFIIKLATIYIDLTLDSDGSDFVMANLTLSWIDSLDEARSLANGIMRYKGTPITSDPNDDSGTSDGGESNEENSDEPENSIPVEDTLICDFTDGPISICFPQNTLIDLHRSYSENGSWTQAHYLPGLNNAKFPSFIINSYTEMNYESLDDWASHTVDSWELPEINATISTNRFQTDSGFQGIWITKKYSGFMGANSFDYFIAIDLSTNAWKQRHLQNQYTVESDWLRVGVSGSNPLTNENEFPTALAVAKSFDYNESFVPKIETYQEIGQDTSSPISLTKSFIDGPISFETPSDTLIDLYRSYSENGSWTQAHYLPGLNNETFPSFIINSYTEMNYESLDDWASHTVGSWELSEINATISTNRFQTDSGFQGIWITKKYSGFMGANSFDYFIAIDLSTNAWKQRHWQNQYTEESDWLRVEFSGSNPLTNENEFPTALAVAKSFDYDESFVPEIETYVAKSSDLSASTKLLVTDLDSGWFFSDWFGLFFDSGSGWIYHEYLEWIYWGNSTNGSWIWADGKDWLWTAEDSFPYLYSDNTKDWIYLSFSEQDLTKAYDFSNESWIDWSDLVLNKTNIPITQNSGGEEAKAIEEIYYSDSMSEEEKIDAIGSIILFGL